MFSGVMTSTAKIYARGRFKYTVVAYLLLFFESRLLRYYVPVAELCWSVI